MTNGAQFKCAVKIASARSIASMSASAAAIPTFAGREVFSPTHMSPGKTDLNFSAAAAANLSENLFTVRTAHR